MTARASITLLNSGPSQRGGATASGGGHCPTNDAFSADQENESGVRLRRSASACEGSHGFMNFVSVRIPVCSKFVVTKCVVPLLNDGNAVVIGDGHGRAIRYGAVD